jgi:hypothetical protein
LRNQQIVQIDSQTTRVLRIERVLDIDEPGQATSFLSLRNDRERQRSFP